MEMLKQDLPGTLCGGEPALSNINLCKLLAMTASAVNKGSVAVWSQANNFAPLTGTQTPVGRMPGAAVEYLDNPKEQHLGVNKPQRDHFNTWWKQQEHVGLRPLSRLKTVRGHASIKVGEVCLLRHGNGTYRLCQLLRPESFSRVQARTVKVVYEDGHGLSNGKNKATPLTEIIVNVQRLTRLAPIDKEELLKAFITYDLRVPRA